MYNFQYNSVFDQYTAQQNNTNTLQVRYADLRRTMQEKQNYDAFINEIVQEALNKIYLRLDVSDALNKIDELKAALQELGVK